MVEGAVELATELVLWEGPGTGSWTRDVWVVEEDIDLAEAGPDAARVETRPESAAATDPQVTQWAHALYASGATTEAAHLASRRSAVRDSVGRKKKRNSSEEELDDASSSDGDEDSNSDEDGPEDGSSRRPQKRARRDRRIVAVLPPASVEVGVSFRAAASAALPMEAPKVPELPRELPSTHRGNQEFVLRMQQALLDQAVEQAKQDQARITALLEKQIQLEREEERRAALALAAQEEQRRRKEAAIREDREALRRFEAERQARQDREAAAAHSRRKSSEGVPSTSRPRVQSSEEKSRVAAEVVAALTPHFKAGAFASKEAFKHHSRRWTDKVLAKLATDPMNSQTLKKYIRGSIDLWIDRHKGTLLDLAPSRPSSSAPTWT